MKPGLCCLALLVLPLCAQEEDTSPATQTLREDPGSGRFWQARLDGGDYVVALDRIAAIGLHEYLLDGGLLVREMSVDTGGRTTARFYHIRQVGEAMPNNGLSQLAGRAGELLDQAARRGGLEVHEMVQNSYPTTTHAGMVEFRVLDLGELDALYESLRDAWTSGRGRRVSFERDEGE